MRDKPLIAAFIAAALLAGFGLGFWYVIRSSGRVVR
jgi:hypothetical protein